MYVAKYPSCSVVEKFRIGILMSTVISSSRNQGYYHEIKSLLVENDPVFAGLEAEKRLGWESKDVERLWQLRTQKLNLQNERKSVHNKPTQQTSENPFAALASDGEEDEEETQDPHNTGGQKVLRAAGKGPSYDKYYSFYRELFSKADRHRSVFAVASKRFMDIGCAPGGLCAYFIRDLGWSGVGFTLQLERGGLKVRFRDPALEVFPCDMSESESVEYICEHVAGSPKFDFVNCGVVMGKHQVESIGEDRETAIQILRVNRNQFLVALKWLAEGGDLFWVFQSSNIGCWFYFLNRLQKCFRKPISLFSTLVPSRSPVYALCSDFDASSPAVKEWIAELESVTEFSEHHLETWNVRTWEQAKPIIDSMKDEIYKIWTTQTNGLREIREAASSQLEKEELLLKKLSGSINATMNVPQPAPEIVSGSFRAPRTTADNTSDWRRRQTPSEPVVFSKDDDGWQVSSGKPSGGKTQSSQRRSTGRYQTGASSSRSSLVDDDDNWRR